MRTASSTASCAAEVWAKAAVVTNKRVNRVRIAVLDARGTDLVAGPRGSAPLNLSCKHSIRSSKVAGTFRAYRQTGKVAHSIRLSSTRHGNQNSPRGNKIQN